MKTITKHKTLLNWSFLLFILIAMFSCEDTPDSEDIEEDSEPSQYGIWVEIETDETYSYLLLVDDLMKDTVISPVNSGIDAEGYIYGTYGTCHDGYYYYPSGTKLSKMEAESTGFEEVDNCIIDDGDYSTYIMKVDWTDYMNVLSWSETFNEEENVIEKKLYRINADDMTLMSSNPFKFPVVDNLISDPDNEGEYLTGDDLSISPTSMTIIEDKAYVGFIWWDWTNWIHTEETYMLICDYPSMENVSVIENDQYGWTSGTWFQSNSAFVDENNDLYFTAIDEDNNYTVLRILSGEDEFDADYAFDLSGYNIYVSGYGGAYDHHTYIKDGIVLMGSCIVDVWNQKVITDLNDMDMGEVQEAYSGGILVEDGILYVIMKTDDARWFVCAYNPDENTLTQGLEIDGGVSSVGRVDKLY